MVFVNGEEALLTRRRSLDLLRQRVVLGEGGWDVPERLNRLSVVRQA